MHDLLIFSIDSLSFSLLAYIIQRFWGGSINSKILLIDSTLFAIGNDKQLIEQVLIISFDFNDFFYRYWLKWSNSEIWLTIFQILMRFDFIIYNYTLQVCILRVGPYTHKPFALYIFFHHNQFLMVDIVWAKWRAVIRFRKFGLLTSIYQASHEYFYQRIWGLFLKLRECANHGRWV